MAELQAWKTPAELGGNRVLGLGILGRHNDGRGRAELGENYEPAAAELARRSQVPELGQNWRVPAAELARRSQVPELGQNWRVPAAELARRSQVAELGQGRRSLYEMG
jgi:hypothetical protein